MKSGRGAMVGVADTDGRPSLDVVRNMTDGQVLEQLLTTGALTRAQVADRTGISRPTVSESVRRLFELDLVVEAGREQGGRGRAGTLLRVPPDVGHALVVHAGPEGVTADGLDVLGEAVTHADRTVVAPLQAADLGPLLVEVVEEVLAALPGPVLTTAVSVADPVHRGTGRTVDLPNAPFLVGELAPRELLAPPLAAHASRHPSGRADHGGRPVGEIEVDNDVNWAVLAEHHEGAARGHDHVVLLYLGPGLGAGTLADGQVVRGGRGLAGEVAHLVTTGPDGRAMGLQAVFGALDLLVADTDAIDVDAVRATLAASPGTVAAEAIVAALADACRSIIALLDPDRVLLGGPWGRSDGLADRVDAAVAARTAIPVPVRPARFAADAALRGARLHASTRLRSVLTNLPATSRPDDA